MQDIYYHRHRGLSTVFAKKFKVFFAKQKKVVLPPSGGGRRAFFSAADRLLARAALRPGVPPYGLWCPRAACGAPMRPAMPPCALRCPRAPWSVPARPAVPLPRSAVSCAPWDAPPCGLRCPHAPLRCPLRPCGAPCALAVPPAPLRCPLRALGLPYTLRVALRASRSLAAHHAPAIQSATLPCLAATLSPAQRRSSPPPSRTAEKRPGRSKRSGRALFISLSGDEAQVSDQAWGLPNWQSLLPESEVHISSMFRGSL